MKHKTLKLMGEEEKRMKPKLLGWQTPLSMVRCAGMKRRRDFEKASARLMAKVWALNPRPRFRWRTFLRAKLGRRPWL